MSQTITLHLPDETIQRYQRSASAAQKAVEEFIAERLIESAPLEAENVSLTEQTVLTAMERLDNSQLREVAQSQLPANNQQLYDELLDKHCSGTLTADEAKMLQALGSEARRLTLKKAHAYRLLKWRGQSIPSVDALQTIE